MNMDDRGQMLLLTALAVCVCLIALTSFITSINEADAVDNPWQGKCVLENTLWAQDCGMEQLARATGNYPWDRRLDLGNDYRNAVDGFIDGISRDLRAHGIAFICEYNDSLASQFTAGKGDASLSESGGVILKKNGSEARVCGCAFDIDITDSAAQYRSSRVFFWG
jgi:hypothetical protein